MTDRQLPRWSELDPLLRPKPITLDATERRLASALTIADLRAIAKRRTPRSVFDYTDGAAEAEISLRRARQLFGELELQPSILHDVSDGRPATSILGGRSELPFAFAPTGFTRMMNHEGERAVVGSPSGAASRTRCRRWGPRRSRTSPRRRRTRASGSSCTSGRTATAGEDLMKRRAAAGYEALDADGGRAGGRRAAARRPQRVHDPAGADRKTVLDAATAPGLVDEPADHRAADVRVAVHWDGTVAELMDKLFDPTMTIEDLDWIRSIWDGPLIIKGIQTVEDARRVVDAGADAIVLSNHGGRQLDRAPAPLRLLPDVAQGGRRPTPRSTSTPASCPAPTSSPPSRSAPTPAWSAAPTSTA